MNGAAELQYGDISLKSPLIITNTVIGFATPYGQFIGKNEKQR
jgi:hypothetical protein